MVLHLAIAIFTAFVGRHAEATNGSALGGVAQLGIATEISHENYFIEGHEEPFFSFLGFKLTAAILLAKNRRIKRSENFHAINILTTIATRTTNQIIKKWFVPFVHFVAAFLKSVAIAFSK